MKTKPIYKFNNGNGATLCLNCRKVINEGFSERLFCNSLCKIEYDSKENELLYQLTLETQKQAEDQIDKEEELKTLKDLVSQLFKMLESVEESDNGYEFHPTVIRSCRVEHNVKLNDILPKIKEIIKDNKPKKAYTDFSKEEVDKILKSTQPYA